MAEAVEQARVTRPNTALLLSVAAASTACRTVGTTGPRPSSGPAIRLPAVAGTFYPRDPDALRRLVDQFLGDTLAGSECWPAVLVPHAGLRFSGRIAAAVFRRVEIPETVIILGPRHTGRGMEWAVTPHHAWAVPGATVPSDPALAAQLAAAIPDLALDARAHEHEHSIEVQLPFLARLAPQSRVVGITVGRASFEECQRFASGLAGVLAQRADVPLLVISSDLHHHANEAENRRLDALALKALQTLEPQALHSTILQHSVTMCGVLPAIIVLETLRRLGKLRRAERVAYATSAEVTGDSARVVGYTGMLFG